MKSYKRSGSALPAWIAREVYDNTSGVYRGSVGALLLHLLEALDSDTKADRNKSLGQAYRTALQLNDKYNEAEEYRLISAHS